MLIIYLDSYIYWPRGSIISVMVPSSSVFEVEFVISALAGFHLQDRQHCDAVLFLPFFINPFRSDVGGRICRSVQMEANEDTQISNDLSGETSQAGKAARLMRF